MARYIKQGTIRDGLGNVISGATVYVYLGGTTTAASVYTAVSGGTAVNSVETDTDGSFSFYVDTSDYDRDQSFKLVISKPGYTSQTWDYEYIILENIKDDVVANDGTSTTSAIAIFSDDLGKTIETSGVLIDASDNITGVTSMVVEGNLYLSDEGGKYISGDGTDLTINSGVDINLTAVGDVNIPANVGVTFGDDGEKIEGDGTNLTIASSGILNLNSTGALVASHQAITDNHVLTVDQVGAADNDYAKFTAKGIEGRSYTEVKQDLDLEIGIDVAAQTHASQHAVSGADTVFPAAPSADKYLMWDNDTGVLVWADAAGGGGAVQQYYGVSWNESADTYVRTGSTAGQPCGVTLADAFLPVQRRMRGCVVADDGTVNYYLCATDWTKKEDGTTASDLTGTDGQVMVEIPKFWYRYGYSGTTHTWEVSPVPLTGFKVHEMFMSDDTEKDYVYVGAYEASLYDVSAKKYVGQCYQTSVSAVFATSDDSITIATRTGWATALAVGQKLVITGTSKNNATVTVKTIESATKITVNENLTNETAATTVIETQTNVTDTTGDKLCSLSGVCPITGGSANGTIAHFRIWAQNRGGGKAANDAASAQWSQMYADAHSGLQLLYLTEYASFYSQSVLGYGIAAVEDWAEYNDENPIAKTGKGNAIGNASGNTATDAITTGAAAKDVYLKYRGIENLYGHIWKFVDGYKVNNNIPYLCNNFANFSDAESTANYTNPKDVNGAAITMHNANGYQGTLELTGRAFMPASITGGAADKKITDYYYQDSGWRVVFSGGHAAYAAVDGAFCLAANNVLALVGRKFGGRLVLRK